MSDSRNPLAGDLVGPGVRRIAAATGMTYQAARRALDNGRLPGCFKLGHQWYGRLSIMDEGLRPAAPPPEPEPAREPARGRARR